MAEAIQKMQKMPRVERLLKLADRAMSLKKAELSLVLALQAYRDKCRFGAFEDAAEIMRKYPLLESVMETCAKEIPPAVRAVEKGTIRYAVENAIAAAKN